MSGLVSLDLDYAKFKKYGITKRQLQRHARDTLRAMAEHWHANFLPRHFSLEAYRRYGYYRRRGEGLDTNSRAYRASYFGRKARKYGETRPLVKTGETRLLAMLRRIEATSNVAKVILPRGLSRRNPSSRVNMRAEVTKVTRDEAAELLEVGRKTLRNLIAKPATT